MGQSVDMLNVLVLACVQCALIAYGAIAVMVPLLKLRAARKLAQASAEETVPASPETAPVAA